MCGTRYRWIPWFDNAIADRYNHMRKVKTPSVFRFGLAKGKAICFR